MQLPLAVKRSIIIAAIIANAAPVQSKTNSNFIYIAALFYEFCS